MKQKYLNIYKTWALFLGFLAVVIGAGWGLAAAYGDSTILYIAVAFSVVMAVTSYWFSDKIVLKMAKAEPVSKESVPELYSAVQKLALKAGLPMPRVYIIREGAPNAFATGRNPEHSVVAVTTGLMDKLDKDELEGVIAHELSHIKNRDMLISTMAVVLVGFIALASDFFMRSLLWRSMLGGRRSNAHPMLILIGVGLAILAPLAASLMRLAISRKREFLADSSGVELTGDSNGLANALIKISSDPTPMLRAANNTTSHLWIDDPFKGQQKTSWLHKLFMTHPPTEERVKTLRGLKI